MVANTFITKIEGHGDLAVDWRKEDVRLNIHEGERLFEGILVGRTAEEAHWITPRICGVCPIAHNLASLAAIEDAYGVRVNDTTTLLRRLLWCGQMIQSHVLHLFFLALPDYIGLDRGTELAQKDPRSFAKALALKELGDAIAHAVGGRNVHPTTTTVGGFHTLPTTRALEQLARALERTARAAEWTVRTFAGLPYPELRVDLELVAQHGDRIVSANGKSSSVRSYKKQINEELRAYSTAKFGTYRGRAMLVGALARLTVLTDASSAPARAPTVDSKNPFHNNLAQAIEIQQFHAEALRITGELLRSHLDATIAKPSAHPTRKGIGAIEAPRGGLYHEIHLNDAGIVTHANIITPTVQNLTSIEESARALIAQTRGHAKAKRERLLRMLVRAYDPCITCSVH